MVRQQLLQQRPYQPTIRHTQNLLKVGLLKRGVILGHRIHITGIDYRKRGDVCFIVPVQSSITPELRSSPESGVPETKIAAHAV